MIKNNKKGIHGMLLVIAGLFLIVMVGIIMALGSSVINWTMDEVVPELDGLGVIDAGDLGEGVNFTVIS